MSWLTRRMQRGQAGLGSSLPLRGLAANNYGPQPSVGVAVSAATTVEIYGRVQYVLGADSTDLIVRFPNWFFQAATGVKNPGSGLSGRMIIDGITEGRGLSLQSVIWK